MAIDITATFRRGGAQSIRLLKYCVISAQMEPLFLYLVMQYQIRPTTPRALAMHDMFCAPDSPGRIAADEVLPPRDFRIRVPIEKLRRHIHEVNEFNAQAPEFPMAVDLPAKYLFDLILPHLHSQADGPIARITESYDPSLEPIENLPGGELTSGQRMFVDRIWMPVIRPCLVRADFPLLASIG